MTRDQALEVARGIVKNIISIGLLEDAGVHGDPKEILESSVLDVAQALLDAAKGEREWFIQTLEAQDGMQGYKRRLIAAIRSRGEANAE